MKREFVTILHTLKSPHHVGLIVRSHGAFGGNEVIFTGHALPWQFKKGSQAFSRQLEKQATILHIAEPEHCLAWCRTFQYVPIALEIASPPHYLPQVVWPPRVALIVGNEASGLDPTFLAHCDQVVTIPQFGPVGSLNVAISASLALYELHRARSDIAPMTGRKSLENVS